MDNKPVDATDVAPPVEHSRLNPFDPNVEPAIEEERLLKAVNARRERLLEVRVPRGEPKTPEHERAQRLYEEASEQLHACRRYWRGLGELAGTRGMVSVVNNSVGRDELEAALEGLSDQDAQRLRDRLGLNTVEDTQP
jgi:hypothetical protein